MAQETIQLFDQIKDVTYQIAVNIPKQTYLTLRQEALDNNLTVPELIKKILEENL